MKYLLFVLVVTSCSTASNQADCIDTSKIKADAICTQEFKPVCGCDEKTYSNECVATNNGVTTWTEGECKTKSGEN